MGFVLGTVATKGSAHLTDFDEASLSDARIRAFQKKVSMRLDPEVDAAHPKLWIGKVEVTLKDGAFDVLVLFINLTPPDDKYDIIPLSPQVERS
jgi:2-methylcitrate dehydratase PrpD